MNHAPPVSRHRATLGTGGRRRSKGAKCCPHPHRRTLHVVGVEEFDHEPGAGREHPFLEGIAKVGSMLLGEDAVPNHVGGGAVGIHDTRGIPEL